MPRADISPDRAPNGSPVELCRTCWKPGDGDGDHLPYQDFLPDQAYHCHRCGTVLGARDNWAPQTT